MRDIFGVNYESNEYECDKLMIKEAEPKMVKKITKAIIMKLIIAVIKLP